MKKESLRCIQLFWAYFIGLGALWGGLMMFIDPTGVMWGMDSLLPILRKGLPLFASLFSNFIASGVVLTLVVGVPNIISIVLIHLRHRLGEISALLSGVFLLLWILFEFYIWGFEGLSVLYFIFALFQIANYWMWKKRI